MHYKGINPLLYMNQTTDGIIFDLDGTLWDSTQAVADAWQASISKLSYVDRTVTQEDVRAIAGMPYDAIYDKLFPNLNASQRQELMALCGEEELRQLKAEGGTLYEGLEETLASLQEKYKLFIVSNCQLGYIDIFLEFHNMQRFFTDHGCFGDNHKPKGENIRALIERNNLKEAVYVGDTKGDYDASQQAGVPFIYARYGFGEVTANVPYIDRFEDLRKLF
ncbi:HAD family hydrolase [Pontibacter saemangeumensis]|uniref:phosphoglycolate phosphatase n=2 Tax=Pontibacter saemangeumensis TaxID=1084525 RepID=A0ABP8LZ61_9BACT